VFKILLRMYENRIFKRDACKEVTCETRATAGMKSKNDKPIIETVWYNVILLVLFICFFYYGTHNGLKINETIWARPRYTGATMLGISKNFRSSNYDIKYKYYENEVEQEDFLSLPKNIIDEYHLKYDGGKYLLVYDSLGIAGSQLLYKCGRLPDTLYIPDEGWLVPPIPWCNKKYQLYDSSIWYNGILLKTLDILNINVKPEEK
jgi:hypothetical protein